MAGLSKTHQDLPSWWIFKRILCYFGRKGRARKEAQNGTFTPQLLPPLVAYMVRLCMNDVTPILLFIYLFQNKHRNKLVS